jgi:hypothetical protein
MPPIANVRSLYQKPKRYLELIKTWLFLNLVKRYDCRANTFGSFLRGPINSELVFVTIIESPLQVMSICS